MSKKSKREYLLEIRERYRQAPKATKTKILNEFCSVCHYERKHAIKLLHQDRRTLKKKPGPSTTYDNRVITVLKKIWFTAEQPCSKRLKVILALWLPYYETSIAPVAPKTKAKLLKISPATIDRILKPIRSKYTRKGLCGTKPGSLLKTQIPIRHQWDTSQPGFLEADTVAHCGDTLAGDFVWSITFTDICSGWTENRAVWNKGAHGVLEQVKDVQAKLPFPILGFHIDNGSEFLNHHLAHYFLHHPYPIKFTRSRPNRRNDNPHVEQKNWTHVRQLLEYHRIDDPDQIPRLNALYHLWSLYQNYFCPNAKLVSKVRIKSRIIKKYDTPITPCQRLLDSPTVKEQSKTQLTTTCSQLNPFTLKYQILQKLQTILAYL
jgi:hypothetical protein